MVYMKHPTLGNAHVSEAEAAKREAAGWVRWPRPWAVKAKTEAPPPARKRRSK